MLRIVLGIVGLILVIVGILALWGHSAAWTKYISEPVWHFWLEILIGVILVVFATVSTKK